jgi:hypothetical protein
VSLVENLRKLGAKTSKELTGGTGNE